MEERCPGCTCELKRGKTRRRKLYSDSTRHVLPSLTDLLREEYLPEDVDQLIPPLQSAAAQSKLEEMFICIPCFRNLEKFMRLETEKSQVQETLKGGFLKVKQFVELRANTQQDEPPTPSRSSRKHSRLLSSSPAGPPKKRHALDTPTRRIIHQVHAPETPSVSVSDCSAAL
jgi:hypothetical protein